jgi:hypothetical protein
MKFDELASATAFSVDDANKSHRAARTRSVAVSEIQYVGEHRKWAVIGSGCRTGKDVEELIKQKKETGKVRPRKRADVPRGRMWRLKLENQDTPA